MAVSAGEIRTYADLRRAPDDHLRRELIDGVLYVTPAPVLRHQRVSGRIFARLWNWVEEHGGEVLSAPTDVYVTEDTVVEPDVLYVTAERGQVLERSFVRGAPDIVVEISSPATRRRDLGVKLRLYERIGVAEYWFADLDADRIEVYRRTEGAYPPPAVLARGDRWTSPLLAGLVLEVDDVLGPVDPRDVGPVEHRDVEHS